MGFKPKSKMKMHHYIKPASFIYPDETVRKELYLIDACITFYRLSVVALNSSLCYSEDAFQEKWLPFASTSLVTTLLQFL